jgi:tRNA-dihydrouridine synthase
MTLMSFWRLIPQPIIGLSPMDGVTDPAFRYIVARHGKPDVQFTEFINVEEILYGSESAWQQLRYAELERPIVAQIYGADPAKFYQVAHVACELGFDGVDINMGCPSKNVSARGCGAALIKNPPLAREIIRSVKDGVKDWARGQQIETIALRPKLIERIKSSSTHTAETPRQEIPVSVKTRLGYDSIVIEDWVSVLLEEQPEVISIHGRTLMQMYKGRADWAAIARAVSVAQGTSTLILGNGDISSMTELISRVKETQVHGVLIGRGGLGNPWLFLQKSRAKAELISGAALNYPLEGDSNGEGECAALRWQVPLHQRFQVALEHARYFETLGGTSRFAAMRKHLGWYCKGFPGAAETRARMFRTTSSRDVESVLAEVGYQTA